MPPNEATEPATPSRSAELDTCFADKRMISARRMGELQQRADGPSLRRLLSQTAAYFGSATALVVLDDPWLIASALLASTLCHFAFFGLLHEACHRTLFVRKPLNLVAAWVAALGQPMAPALMQAFHFEHHRHTHQRERDPELAGMSFMVRWPTGLMWVVTLSGLPIVFARLAWTTFAAIVPPGAVWNRVLPFVRPQQRRVVARQSRALALVHGGAMAAAVLWVPEIWRIYAALVLGHALLSLYITCEHRGLDEQGSILERTRSLIVPSWVRWLLWNMPYHAEHHGWPAVPWHNLPALHEEVREQLVHRVSPRHLYAHSGREVAAAATADRRRNP